MYSNTTEENAATKNVKFLPPLVSVIICNYNYAEFIDQCVASVKLQNYENIELLIIDDCSTDGSSVVLQKISATNPDIYIIFREKNGGQSAASLEALSQIHGQYVVFLDADDILLEDFVSLHVAAHLSLRNPVGFTCSDMAQFKDGAIVISSFVPFSGFIERNEKKRIKPRSVVLPIPCCKAKQALPDLYQVDLTDRGWPWSAMSAMMFRKDALSFWEDAEGLDNLRHCTDVFFCYGINTLIGSVLIDAPLTAYRIHGRNGFASRVHLANVRNFDSNLIPQRSVLALNLILNHVRRKEKFFERSVWLPSQIEQLRRVICAQISDEMSLYSGVRVKHSSLHAVLAWLKHRLQILT